MNRQAASPLVALAVMPHCQEPMSVASCGPKRGSGTIWTSPGNAFVYASNSQCPTHEIGVFPSSNAIPLRFGFT